MTDTAERHVGKAVRAARMDVGLSLRELARKLDVSPATVSAIENGKTGLSVTRLQEVAALLGVAPSRLIGSQDLAPVPRRVAPKQASGESTLPGWREFAPLAIDPVLSAAIDCFVETGYHGTSMRTLAARIGVSVPAIYHHYADKQQLLVRILDVTMTELHRRVSAARAQAVTSLDEVSLVVEALALFHSHRRKLAFIGASEMRSLEGPNRRRITDSRNRLQHILDDAIEAALADGYLHTSHPRAAGRAIATMCTSLPQWFRLGGSLTPDGIASAYVEFALSMLGASRPSNPDE